MSKRLYIKLLEQEVERLGAENYRLTSELKEAKKSPMQREMEKMRDAMCKNTEQQLYGLGGIVK